MEMIPVRSSAIAAIGHDPATRRMRIHFTNGDKHDLCDVPESVFERLATAPSKDRFYDQYIRDRYSAEPTPPSTARL